MHKLVNSTHYNSITSKSPKFLVLDYILFTKMGSFADSAPAVFHRPHSRPDKEKKQSDFLTSCIDEEQAILSQHFV